MAVKLYVLFTMLVFAGVVPPLAHAQLGLLNAIFGISGVVPCGVANSINLSTSTFPNATVQLRCGNNVVSSTTTDKNGAFSMITAMPTGLLSLLSNCNVFVATPLVTCNASLSSAGNLVAPLVGSINNILGLITLVVGSFSLQ